MIKTILESKDFSDYELLDSGFGRRLERFGSVVLDRPDPEIIWAKSLPDSEWKKTDMVYKKFGGKGKWVKTKLEAPDKWIVNIDNIKLVLRPSPFKHVGIFPEQAGEWRYVFEKIKNANSQVNVLNLFAYTGAATMFAAKAGAKVTHVDASKPAITWANENREINGLKDAPIRWIIDDVTKFTDREIKRGAKYDVIIMDPPVYGHGPSGIPWDFAKDFPRLLNSCRKLLSDKPLFVLVNAYAVSMSAQTLMNAFDDNFGKSGTITGGELAIKPSRGNKVLTTGIWTNWENS